MNHCLAKAKGWGGARRAEYRFQTQMFWLRMDVRVVISSLPKGDNVNSEQPLNDRYPQCNVYDAQNPEEESDRRGPHPRQTRTLYKRRGRSVEAIHEGLQRRKSPQPTTVVSWVENVSMIF